MADIFDDSPVNTDFGTDPAITTEPLPTVTPVPVPVQDQQGTLDLQASDSNNTVSDDGTQTSEGMEEVPASDSVTVIDYTDILTKQNENLETLILEQQKTNQELTNIQNAMPGVMCMLGVVIGLLLLQIFASYIRP
ncbi:MAG: hypothetical protein PUI16_02675 [Clostridia bacterium]|nr:hypothetical protein [Clostridia bacterium]MDY5555664.1 hypothetical protein [Blautia sp.]